MGSRPPELFFFCPVAAGFFVPELLLFVFWEVLAFVFLFSGISNYRSFVYKMRIFYLFMSNTNLVGYIDPFYILYHYIPNISTLKNYYF